MIEAQRANVKGAQERYVELKRLNVSTLSFIVVVHRVLGLLAHTIGNLDDAQSHFEEALAFCNKAGNRPELAWSLCDYADMLRERNNEGDRDKLLQVITFSFFLIWQQQFRTEHGSKRQCNHTGKNNRR